MTDKRTPNPWVRKKKGNSDSSSATSDSTANTPTVRDYVSKSSKSTSDESGGKKIGKTKNPELQAWADKFMDGNYEKAKIMVGHRPQFQDTDE